MNAQNIRVETWDDYAEFIFVEGQERFQIAASIL